MAIYIDELSRYTESAEEPFPIDQTQVSSFWRIPGLTGVSKGFLASWFSNPCQALSRPRRASVPEGCLCGTPHNTPAASNTRRVLEA
jgi:hypothetical protein